jgi:uncharacterized DUF497 family protein
MGAHTSRIVCRSFDEAQIAFLDENARLLDDPDHSEDEERFVLLGYSFQARCLIE